MSYLNENISDQDKILTLCKITEQTYHKVLCEHPAASNTLFFASHVGFISDCLHESKNGPFFKIHIEFSVNMATALRQSKGLNVVV